MEKQTCQTHALFLSVQNVSLKSASLVWKKLHCLPDLLRSPELGATDVSYLPYIPYFVILLTSQQRNHTAVLSFNTHRWHAQTTMAMLQVEDIGHYSCIAKF